MMIPADMDALFGDQPELFPGGICASVDPELFFPEKGGSTKDAKRICKSCPAQPECLQYALDNDIKFGVWGGLSERERRRLTRQATSLSLREQQVSKLRDQGIPNAEIATQLKLSTAQVISAYHATSKKRVA